MQLQYFLAVLKARWMVASLAFALGAGAVLGAMLLQAKRYSATASVLIDVKSPDPVAGMVLQGMTSPSYMLTQVDVIQSPRVAAGAARILGSTDDPNMDAAWRHATDGRGNRDSWIAEQIAEPLDARPSRGSNVINVTYTASTPQLAAAGANAFAQSYLDTSIELRTEPAKQYRQFFDDQARQMRARLETAQARLSAYQRSAGIVATDERLDLEMTRLADLTTKLATVEGAVAESRGRSGEANAHPERVAQIAVDPSVVALRADLSRQEGRLEELNLRLGEAHPQVRELRAAIIDSRRRLDEAIERAARGISSAYAVDKSRMSELRGSLELQRAKVLQVRGSRDEANVLLQDVSDAKRSYDAVLARLNQTGLESQTVQANMSLLAKATEPPRALRMRLRNVALLGVVVGAFGALLLAGIAELRDRRLRTLSNLTALMNQLPTVVIPAFRKHEGAAPLSGKRRALAHRSADTAVNA